MTQRKGQWLCNQIRKDYKGINESHHIAQTLWNMTDKEFDRIMNEQQNDEAVN